MSHIPHGTCRHILNEVALEARNIVEREEEKRRQAKEDDREEERNVTEGTGGAFGEGQGKDKSMTLFK